MKKPHCALLVHAMPPSSVLPTVRSRAPTVWQFEHWLPHALARTAVRLHVDVAGVAGGVGDDLARPQRPGGADGEDR